MNNKNEIIISILAWLFIFATLFINWPKNTLLPRYVGRDHLVKCQRKNDKEYVPVLDSRVFQFSLFSIYCLIVFGCYFFQDGFKKNVFKITFQNNYSSNVFTDFWNCLQTKHFLNFVAFIRFFIFNLICLVGEIFISSPLYALICYLDQQPLKYVLTRRFYLLSWSKMIITTVYIFIFFNTLLCFEIPLKFLIGSLYFNEQERKEIIEHKMF